MRMAQPFEISWSEEKNLQLKIERKLSFEEVAAAIENGSVLDDIAHPYALRKGSQRLLLVEINGYVCVVPYVREGTRMFLKPIYRSRAMQKKFRVKK
jgi:hypothetical protein